MRRRVLSWTASLGLLVAPALLWGSDSDAGVARQDRFRVDLPAVALRGVPFDVAITALDADGDGDTSHDSYADIEGLSREVDGRLVPVVQVGPFERGRYALEDVLLPESGVATIVVRDRTGQAKKELRAIPGFLSLLPPILAILLALTVREVLLALLAGVWLGSTLVHGYDPFSGLLHTLDNYLVGSIANADHAAIILFTLTLGGMVGVISRSGGTQGIVAALSRWAKRPRGGQIATWAMGVFIFFDDYANTLIVGNTMRPLSDTLRLSREKLSFIVDATAAPVTSIAVISSWVGFQVGLIDQAFEGIEVERDAYLTFLMSVPYASYSILMIIFVLVVGWSLRDFGPMLAAERRSVAEGKLLADGAQPLVDDQALDLKAEEGTPLRWYNAAAPIATVVIATMVGLYVDGRSAMGAETTSAHLGEVIGAASSFNVLMWASFLGAALAVVMAVSQRIMTLKASLEALLSGVKAMMVGVIILVLAWSIGDVCGDLSTAGYVISMSRDILSPHFLPLLTFVVAAFIAFSTGTSWATMAILTPIVVPMAAGMTAAAGMQASLAETILLATVGAVLSGSVFGDHCSPISDTTIMSSMTSAADHVDHVRTQLPYALSVGGVASLVGYLPSGFGLSPWISIPVGAGILTGAVFLVGKTVPGRDKISTG